MRLFMLILAVALVWLQARLWVAGDGLRAQWALETEVELQSAQNTAWTQRNEALEAEVRDLKQGLAAAEERARADLGLIGPDETFYQIIPPSALD
jgi:cell division protein FtsB